MPVHLESSLIAGRVFLVDWFVGRGWLAQLMNLERINGLTDGSAI